jgi:hypothetical protein
VVVPSPYSEVREPYTRHLAAATPCSLSSGGSRDWGRGSRLNRSRTSWVSRTSTLWFTMTTTKYRITISAHLQLGPLETLNSRLPPSFRVCKTIELTVTLRIITKLYNQ